MNRAANIVSDKTHKIEIVLYSPFSLTHNLSILFRVLRTRKAKQEREKDV